MKKAKQVPDILIKEIKTKLELKDEWILHLKWVKQIETWKREAYGTVCR